MKHKIIFSNYSLFNIPYLKITKLSELGRIRGGYCCWDELWIWLEAGVGKRMKIKITKDILKRSRKRSLTISFTTQTLENIPTMIRDVLDFTAYPILSRTGQKCKLLIFAGSRGKHLLRQHYFNAEVIKKLYDTNEEVQDIIDDVTAGGGDKNEIIEELRNNPIGRKVDAGIPFNIENPLLRLNQEEKLPKDLTLRDALGGAIEPPKDDEDE